MEKINSSLVFLLLCLCGISLTEAFGFSVELIYRDSSKSPFYLPTETHYQRVANAIRRSINRVNHFNQQNSVSTNTIESDVTSNRGEYLMSYSIGTPPFKTFGVVDTGSDIVWLQCKPCDPCFNQTSPIFDPSKSTTYKKIPCYSTTCQSVRDTSCSSDDQQNCEYNIQYGDHSQSQGDLSLETLTLGSTSTGSPIKFPKTVIGCGLSNTVSFQGKSSGIVGLGNGPVSLISQLSSSISGKFSYCLVPMISSSNTSSKLNFGDNAVVSGDDSVSTPTVPKVFYYLTLEGFSVGDKRIDFGSSSSAGNNEPGNIIIDSGTTLTILPDDVYSKLESAVADAVKLERADDPSQILSLCYEASSLENLEVPVITAHFNGADIQLNAINTFVQVADEVVCFAFTSSPDPNINSIFGNLAQQNFLVGYDLQKKVVSFKPTDCTKQ